VVQAGMGYLPCDILCLYDLFLLENNMNKRIKKEQKIENMFFSKYLTKKMMRNAGKIKAAVKA
jgi:hypothetical protein